VKTLRQTMKTLFSRPPMLAALSALALLAGNAADAQTVTCSTAAGSTNCFAQIPDAYHGTSSPGVLTYTAGTLNSTLVVPAGACTSAPVSTVTAQVKLKHTWVGDLVVTLIHPNGSTTATLLNRPDPAAPSNCSRDDVDATFQDGAGTQANTSCNFTIPAITGVVAPVSPLSAFSGLTGAGTWTLRVQDANAGEYGYLEDWSLTFACVPLPTVTIAATTPQAIFPSQNGQFTVTRVGDLTNPLTVSYTVGGTATGGVDYTALSGTVTILAGQASATISVPPLLVPPTARTVIATLSASGNYTIGGASAATVTILSAPLPTVSIVATAPSAFFPSLNGQFTVTRTGDLTNPLTVNYTVGGTATAGVDYTALSGSVTIPGGQASATISVPPLLVPPTARTVIATLSASANYTIGTSPATVTITSQAPAPTATDVPALSPLLLLALAGALAAAGMLVVGTGRFRM
jgi:subtilisin-like proprotein convertase family protein